MAKVPANHNKDWTKAQDAQLKTLAAGNTPTRVIAIKLERTPAAVQNHASQIGVSLRPNNQRPNKGKK
jgi:hypothetical protein